MDLMMYLDQNRGHRPNFAFRATNVSPHLCFEYATPLTLRQISKLSVEGHKEL